MEVILSKKPKVLFKIVIDGKIIHLTDVSDIIMSYIGIWTFISESTTLSIEILGKYKNNIDWEAYIAGCNPFTNKIVEKFSNKLVWSSIFNKWMKDKKNITENHVYLINASIGSINDKDLLNASLKNKKWFYSETFIDNFSDMVDWRWIINNRELSLLMMSRYFFRIHLYYGFYKYQKISNINFLKKWSLHINWSKLSKYQPLSNEHFAEFYKVLDWECIFNKYTFSPVELEKLPKYVIYRNIDIISETQPLNKKYVFDNINILNPTKMLKNKCMKDDTMQRIYKNCSEEKYVFKLSKNCYVEFDY